jgi:protein-tyrosine phosphatase
MTARGVAFRNVFNFRDLGGYPTADGHRLRWARLYRSDDLSRLPAGEVDRLAALGIHTVVDLRRDREIEQTGRIPDFAGLIYHHIHLPHPHWEQPEFADTAQRAAFLRERYRELTEAAGPEIAATLALVADAASAPLVFHCVAGKDRTGVIAALVLSLLGVDRDIIADDYHLSEAAEPAVWAYYARERAVPPADRWRRITISPRAGILHLLDDLALRYGSVRAYAQSIGVTGGQIAAMKTHLLEPAPPDKTAPVTRNLPSPPRPGLIITP